MARECMAQILERISKLPSEEEQIKALQINAPPALKQLLHYCYSPSVKWALPEGEPPYTECTYPNMERMLTREIRRLYLFVEGGNDNLKPLKRETLFIDVLEHVHPDDAKLLIAIKDGHLPYEGLSKKTVEKAYGVFK